MAGGAGEVAQFGYSSRNWLGLVLHIFLSELLLRQGEPVGGGEVEAAGVAAGKGLPAATVPDLGVCVFGGTFLPHSIWFCAFEHLTV